VRLWDQDDLIAQLLQHYETMDGDLRAELPLKRVWLLASPAEDEES
jgi:restriction system protein